MAGLVLKRLKTFGTGSGNMEELKMELKGIRLIIGSVLLPCGHP